MWLVQGLLEAQPKPQGPERSRIEMEAITLVRRIQEPKKAHISSYMSSSSPHFFQLTFYSDPLYYGVVFISSLVSSEKAGNKSGYITIWM